MEHTYDAIVIGSGISGLTTAALLSKTYQKKVLVLEKHWVVGGLTHQFERKRKYSWDVGVHYIGAMEQGELTFDLFDYITDGQLEWEKIEDPYDVFWYPDIKFGAVSGQAQLQAKLIELFPAEAAAIKGYFKDIKKAIKWGRDKFLAITLPGFLRKLAKHKLKAQQDFMLQPVHSYFEKRFKDSKLIALLQSQWGDYGVAPDKAVFWVHASVVNHYMNGAYYPKGGAKKIAATIQPVIEKNGGACKTNCEVTEIIVENNKAVGVRYKERVGRNWQEKTVYASRIISSVGAKLTYHQLLKQPLHKELNELNQSTTAVTIYLGLKDNPSEALGVHGGNFWIFNDYDHISLAGDVDIVHGLPNMCFLSFPSLKDSSKQSHTAEIVSFVNYQQFEQWKDKDWQNRGAAYEAFKQSIAEKYINFVESKLPGFSAHIDFVEVSTPLTLEKFTSKQGGAMYGLPSTKERFMMDCLQPTTSVQNLYLAGVDAFMVGVCGGLISGCAAAALAGSKWSILSLMPKITMSLRRTRAQKQQPDLRPQKGWVATTD